MPRTGFTTTEMVVALVVAGVALILAVAYFRSQGASRAREITRNNLRQWGIALNLYLIDSRNTFPLAGARDQLDKENAWYNALPPYLSQPGLQELAQGSPDGRPRIGKPSLWINPAAKEPQPPEPGEIPFTYGMNAWLSSTPKGYCRIYDLPNPMAVAFLAEVESYAPNVTAQDVASRFGSSNPDSPDAVAHFLFTDGHVEAVPRSVFAAESASDNKSPPAKFTWVPFPGAPAPK